MYMEIGKRYVNITMTVLNKVRMWCVELGPTFNDFNGECIFEEYFYDGREAVLMTALLAAVLKFEDEDELDRRYGGDG